MYAISSDWREASFSPENKALCGYAEKLTLSPNRINADDVEILRGHGLDDRTIHDAIQVIAYFNYIDRVADALGIDHKSFIRPWEQGPDPLD